MGVPRASFAQAYVVASDDPEELGIESSKAKKEAVDVVSSEQEAFAFNTPGSGVARRSRPTRGTRSSNKSQQRSSPSPIGMEWSPLATILSEEIATKLRFDPTPAKEEPESSTAGTHTVADHKASHGCEDNDAEQTPSKTNQKDRATTSDGAVRTTNGTAQDLLTPLANIHLHFSSSRSPGFAFTTSTPGEKASRGRKNTGSGARGRTRPVLVAKTENGSEPSKDSILAWTSTSSTGAMSPDTDKQNSNSPGKARRLERMQKAAEKLRREGNTAFGERKWLRARELYTEAIELLSDEESVGSSVETQLASLLANRAATWLSLGLPHKAIEDCLLGLRKSPGNARCGVRLATCHLRLGNFPAALTALQKLERELPASKKAEEDNSSVESKRQEICICARELAGALQRLATPHELPADTIETFFGLSYRDLVGGGSPASQTSTTDREAQAVLDRLHSTVPHSAMLLAARAAYLVRLGQFLGATRIARQALTGFGKLEADCLQKEAWRLWILAQASHAAGEVEETVARLEDLQRLMDKKKNGSDAAQQDETQTVDDAVEEITTSSANSAEDVLLACVLGLPQEPSEFIKPLRDAMQLKQQGNANVAASKFDLAVDLYTKALMPALPPRAAAVLFCNRAAAWLGTRQLAQAVADAARAACLAPDYAKAHSRLAAALEQVKRYSEAADALQKALRCPGLAEQERKAYRQRLLATRQQLDSQSTPVADHYGLLGVARGCSNDDVKRAFKKLALQLHPDKLAHSVQVTPVLSTRDEDSRGGCLPEDARARLQESATWLFKCLGEANDVLCDPVRRRELDRTLFPAANATEDARWRPESYGPFGPAGTTWNTRPAPHHFYHHPSRRDQTWNGVFGNRY